MNKFKVGDLVYVINGDPSDYLIAEVTNVRSYSLMIKAISGKRVYNQFDYWPMYLFKKYIKKNCPEYLK